MSQQENRRGAERNEYTGAGDGSGCACGGSQRRTQPAILAIFGDVEANTFLPWFPLKSLEEARQLFERQYQPVYRAERGYQYAICLKEDDIPIGYVKVDLDESHDLAMAAP